MFALAEIQNIHDELSSGPSENVERVFAIGVTQYISRISDGDSVYIGPDVAKPISE